jgi:trk system potassium uptake protein TrkA
LTEVRGKILRKIGADDLVYPEGESATRWAHRLTLPHLRDYVELGEGHSLVQVTAPSAFCDKTPALLQLRQKFGINLVAIKRMVSVQKGAETSSAEKHIITIPHADTTIHPNDILVLVGSDEAISKLPHD